MPHNHISANLDSKFRIGLILNTGFAIFEFVIGILSGSLALISDSGHNLTDSLTLLIAFIAEKIGNKKADTRHSYGHERVTIIAALLNALILVLMAVYIFYQAVQRFMNPEPVSGGLVAIVALVGIFINGSIAFIFSKDKDLHTKSAFLNMAFDTLASVGALLAGIIIYFTNQTIADPITSILIGIMLLIGAGGIVKDSVNILLEGVPQGLDVDMIKASIKKTEYVKEVDDLHIWSLSSHDIALSCHIVVDKCNLPKSTVIVKSVKENLQKQFKIDHATIEVELLGCESAK